MQLLKSSCPVQSRCSIKYIGISYDLFLPLFRRCISSGFPILRAQATVSAFVYACMKITSRLCIKQCMNGMRSMMKDTKGVSGDNNWIWVGWLRGTLLSKVRGWIRLVFMPPSKPTISYSPQSHSLRSRRSMNDLPLSESSSGRRDSTEQLLSKEEEEESEGVTRVNIPQHNSNWYPDEDFELDDENYASIARPPPQRASELLYAFRFVFVFAGVGFGFLILKLVLMKFGHNHGGHHQVAERHYYNGSEWFAPTVIMISLDGFRDDYLDRGVTPNLQQFGMLWLCAILYFCDLITVFGVCRSFYSIWRCFGRIHESIISSKYINWRSMDFFYFT